VDSLVALMHLDPRDLGLICWERNAKSVFEFKNPIFFMICFKEMHPLSQLGGVSFVTYMYDPFSVDH